MQSVAPLATGPARTSFTLTQPSQPSAHAATSNPAGATALPTPPELEQTLALLSSHRSVLGYLLLSRDVADVEPTSSMKEPHMFGIIRHSGVVFEGEQGRRYANAVGRIVASTQAALEEVSEEKNEGDEIRFMRIRTKRHEIMISPGASLHLVELRIDPYDYYDLRQAISLSCPTRPDHINRCRCSHTRALCPTAFCTYPTAPFANPAYTLNEHRTHDRHHYPVRLLRLRPLNNRRRRRRLRPWPPAS